MKGDKSDLGLLKGLAKNDARSIELIYKANFPSIQSYILNNNGSYDDAKDIFQEAMIVLYEKSQSESFVLTSKLTTYVHSVCRRLWLKRLQQLGKYSNQIDDFPEIVSVDEDLEAHLRKNSEFVIMDRALNSLGEPCKSLLEGFYIKQQDMQTLAKLFGYTNADNAKNQKYKCLVRLKKLFFAQYNIGD